MRYNTDMRISDEQDTLIRQWAQEGISLNGIQKNLNELGCSIQFMDLRFYLLDHGIEIAQPKVAEEEKAPEAESSSPAAEASTKSVQVSIDELQIPGTMISGKALFPSGARGAWQFDHRGQFSWSDMSGAPSQDELRSFQVELNKLLSQAS